MVIANVIALILVLFGCLDWFVMGVSGFSMIAGMCMGAFTPGAIAVYSLLALAALWLVVSAIVSRGHIRLTMREKMGDRM